MHWYVHIDGSTGHFLVPELFSFSPFFCSPFFFRVIKRLKARVWRHLIASVYFGAFVSLSTYGILPFDLHTLDRFGGP